MKKRNPAIYIIATLLVGTLLAGALLVCIPIFSWMYNHRFIFQTDEIIGMTLDEVEEEYGEHFYHETFIYTKDGYQQDVVYYIIRPRRKGFIDARPAVLYVISFRDGIATSCHVDKNNDFNAKYGSKFYGTHEYYYYD